MEIKCVWEIMYWLPDAGWVEHSGASYQRMCHHITVVTLSIDALQLWKNTPTLNHMACMYTLSQVGWSTVERRIKEFAATSTGDLTFAEFEEMAKEQERQRLELQDKLETEALTGGPQPLLLTGPNAEGERKGSRQGLQDKVVIEALTGGASQPPLLTWPNAEGERGKGRGEGRLKLQHKLETGALTGGPWPLLLTGPSAEDERKGSGEGGLGCRATPTWKGWTLLPPPTCPVLRAY